ncbi:MAG: M3 family metallopeptidase [Myxococcota bacterium]
MPPDSNPLAEVSSEIPFDRIRASHVVPAIEGLLTEARAHIRQISTGSGPYTYENTLGSLEAATEKLEVAMTIVGHLESVTSNPELREAYNKVKPEVSAFYAGIPLDAGVYAALRAFASTPEAKALPKTEARFLERTLDDFKRHGAELDAAGKQRLEALTREFAEVTLKFSQNVLDATAAWELLIDDPAKLAGLPDSAKEAAAESAKQKGQSGWRFTLQAPSVIAVLTYLDDRAIREQVWRAYNSRGAAQPFDNRPLIERILELRREKAQLLGYRDFADLVLADRMAKTGGRAKSFIDDLAERSKSAFAAENKELEAFRAEQSGQSGPLSPWDLGYWSEKLRVKKYDFDQEALRPYFPLERVVSGLFSTVQRLYGLEVVEAPELPRWSAEVKAYRVKDSDGVVLGSFYSDFFPRDEKRGGAWMNGLITGFPWRGQPHVGLICANVSPPVAGKPALLTHDEVETLFHEFGHLLHHLLSKVEVRSLAGTNVAWDFVELPSQIMENWCWEREALDLFGRHYETGATIPEDLFKKMTAARTFRAANAMMRQIGFATVDLSLHMEWQPGQKRDVFAWARDVMQRFSPAKLPEDYGFIASFSHLFSSEVAYAAGYYSYKWAEVLDADAFTRFQREGVFNREVGRAFRQNVLERGNAAEASELYRGFMGREPDLNALLVRSGLKG